LGGFDTDEEKYITASDRSESENPQDTENLKEQEAERSPDSSAYPNSGPGVRSNDDFRRVFKNFRFVPVESKSTYGTFASLRGLKVKKTVSGNSPLTTLENEDLPSPNLLRSKRRLKETTHSKAQTVH